MHSLLGNGENSVVVKRNLFLFRVFHSLTFAEFKSQNVVGYWQDYWCVWLLPAGCPRQDT